MYKIERKSSGYLLTLAGTVETDEMQKWVDESKMALTRETATSFGVIVDMRNLAPLPPETQELMVQGQKLYMDKGMKRSAVAVNNKVTALQFKRLAKESGIYQWERYVDASSTPDWAGVAIKWVVDGIDPDN